MTKTKAYAVPASKAPLAPFSIERREPKEHDVAIDIKYCGICHSDIHQARDEWGGAIFPLVPGHEIAGVVTKVGSKVTKFKVGDQVGVGCMVDSCRHCEHCEIGLEQFCLEEATFTYNSYEDRGKSKTYTYGGYSGHIVVDENFVLKIPSNLPLDKAAPLLCAGITTYSPLRHWKAGPGKKIAVLGLGGLGHMAVKLAHAMGADVAVLSHSNKKEADAKLFGADHFYDMSNQDYFTKLQNSFDLILNTVSTGVNWNEYAKLLRLDGTMVMIGLPEKPNQVSAGSLIRGRKNFGGSLIGGIKETQEMLDFCSKHNITCEIEVIPAAKINEAFERVLKSDVRYRFVIDMASL